MDDKDKKIKYGSSEQQAAAFCPYCMSPLGPGEVCPTCGLTKGAYEPAPHHLPPGTVLAGRYLVGRVLGEGGFGITYIGCDLRLEMKVAIKEYFPSDHVTRNSTVSLSVVKHTAGERSYEKGVKRFLVEARTMARMEKQPEIVMVRDYFEANDTAYIVMEYVDGTNFNDLVKQRGSAIPPEELFPMIEPLFDALAVVHKEGLLHRDISPDNLMLENGKVRLLDFGCAREASSGNETLTIALKQGYGPIEQYQERGQGPWTDVYALSATIYYCLTGRKPPQALDRTLDDELVPPRKLGVNISEQQEKALLKGLAVNPKSRYQSVEELHAGLYAPVPDPDPIPVIDESEIKVVTNGVDKDAQTTKDSHDGTDNNDEGIDKKDSKTTDIDNSVDDSLKTEITDEDSEHDEKPETDEITEIDEKQESNEEPKPDDRSKKKGLIIGIVAAIAVIVIIAIVATTSLSNKQNSVSVSSISDLLSVLEDASITNVIWEGDDEITGADISSGILELTKPLEIAEGSSLNSAVTFKISGDGKLYVESGACMEFTTTGIITSDGGSVIVEDGGEISGVSLLFTESEADATINGVLDCEQSITYSEDELFGEAKHVTTTDEFWEAVGSGVDAIVIDAELTFEDSTGENVYIAMNDWDTDILVSENGALLMGDKMDGQDIAILLADGHYLVNHGVITMAVFHNDSSGVFINYGEASDFYSEQNQVGNPTIINMETLNGSVYSNWMNITIYNYGTINWGNTFYKATLYNSGTINSEYDMYINGVLENYGEIYVSCSIYIGAGSDDNSGLYGVGTLNNGYIVSATGNVSNNGELNAGVVSGAKFTCLGTYKEGRNAVFTNEYNAWSKN